LCLLIAVAGCQHQVTALSPAGKASGPMPPQEIPPAPKPNVKVSSAPKKDLPPAVLVSWGDFKAGEAFAPDISPARRQEIRDSARQDYEQALKADPKNIPAYQGLARVYTAMHNYDRAIETYQLALKLAPNGAPLWYELGMCHNYQRNWNSALECLDRAAQLEPTNRTYNNALGIVLAESGRYHESLDCFVRVNGQAMGHLRLAQTLQRLNQPELSRQYLAVALQKDPNLATMLRNDSEAAQLAAVQQTAYQAATTPPAPSAPGEQPAAPTPAPSPEPAPPPQPSPPRVLHVDMQQTKNPAEPLDMRETKNPPVPQPVLVPPPPSVSPQDPAPAAMPGLNP
jgi:hypothetical protein